jgi:hypothetical protein
MPTERESKQALSIWEPAATTNKYMYHQGLGTNAAFLFTSIYMYILYLPFGGGGECD